MESKQLKGHGYVRKSKAAGLVCGIVLGAALFAGANSASADEVAATPAPTTTAETPAPKAQGQAQDSTITVDEGLTDAANKAKEAGLTVNAEPTKNIGTANTEEEVKKLDEQAKKEVAAQKAEIEQKAADYAAAVTSAEKNQKTAVERVVKDPLLYYGVASQLEVAGDNDYNNGKVSYGEFTSNKGKVKFIQGQSNVDLGNLDQLSSLVSASEGSQKEINTYYGEGNLFPKTSTVVDKKNAKVVPIKMSEGETISYKLNYTDDSELGKLGVSSVENKVTLLKSPVNTGKTVLLVNRYGSVNKNFVAGGMGKANDVLKIGDWSYEFSKTYYDKNGKVIDPKELTAKVLNKYTFGGKDLVKASDIVLPVRQEPLKTKEHNVKGVLGTEKNAVVTYGGESYYKTTLEYTITREGEDVIDPHAHSMLVHSEQLEPVDTSRFGVPAKPSVKYHLVSYKKAVKSTLPGDNATGSVTVEHVTDKGEVLQATKDVVKNGKVGSDYTTEAGKFDTKETVNEGGKVIERSTTYKLVETPANAKGKVVEGITHVKYVYTKSITDKDVTPKPVEKYGSVTVEHVTDKGEVLQATKDVVKNGKVGSDYTTEAGKFDTKETVNEGGKVIERSITYKLVETPANAKGKVVEGITHVKYVYTKSVADKDVTPKPVEKYGSVTVEHVTDKGEVLQATKDVVKNGKVGSDYITEAGHFEKTEVVEEGGKVIKRITTYKLVETPANAKGKVVEGATHVKYVYTKSVTDKDMTPKPTPLPVNDPTTIHIDRDGKEIAPKEKGTKGFKKIPGYEADPTSLLNKEDPKGQSVRVYRKVEPKVDPKENPVTIHIDTEGKTVAPKEDGTKGFKEIPGYEKYPEDPKNVENVGGITVRVYKKLEEKPVQPTTSVEPAQPSPAAPATQKLNALPETGTATSILSVVGAALGGLGVVGLKSKKDEE